MLGAAAAAAVMCPAWAQETMKIGLLATLEGPFAAPGQDSMRGADLALKEKNGMAGGKKIEFIKVSSDATPDKAVAATRKAVEQDKVPVMIGPLSGDEGIAVKNYAKTQPNVTFINGTSAFFQGGKYTLGCSKQDGRKVITLKRQGVMGAEFKFICHS